MRRSQAASLSLVAALVPRFAHAEEGATRSHQPGRYEGGPYEPSVAPTPLWAAMQLLPSPMLGMGSGGARFGMSWQLTPVSYSWGLNRKVSPWRFLVVEPHARQGGSIEAFVTPEIFFGPKVSPAVRPGVRAYFPVLSRGEYLSLSLGTSYQRIDGRDAVALEAGAYVLFGIVGLQVSQVPAPDTPLSTIATIRLRYF